MRALLGIAVVIRAESERLLLTGVPDLVDLTLFCSLCVCVFAMEKMAELKVECRDERSPVPLGSVVVETWISAQS